jgi:hypothetical protein
MTPGRLPLRDIRLPDEPGWWPPAPGWWLLGLAGTVALAWLLGRGWRRVQRWRRRRARRALLDELLGAAGAAPAARAQAASEALRRVLLAEAPQTLRLRGQDWLAWLDRGLPDAPFAAAHARGLLELPYRSQVDAAEVEQLHALIRRRLLTEWP